MPGGRGLSLFGECDGGLVPAGGRGRCGWHTLGAGWLALFQVRKGVLVRNEAKHGVLLSRPLRCVAQQQRSLKGLRSVGHCDFALFGGALAPVSAFSGQRTRQGIVVGVTWEEVHQ